MRFAVAYVTLSLIPACCHQHGIMKNYFSKVYKVLMVWTAQLPKYELCLPREAEENFKKGQRFQQLQRFQYPLITYVADEEKASFY